MKSLIILLAAVMFCSAYDTNFADSLTPPQKARLDSAARSFSLSGGCKGTLAKTHSIFACPEAASFYDYAAWYAKADKPQDFIIDKLRQHDETYFSPKKFKLAPSTIPAAGNPKTPITIIAYVTSDCPHCKSVGIPLRELTNTYLKTKASFQIKPIHHTIGDYALLAAAEQGKAWQLFEAYADIETRMDETAVLKAAASVKIDTVKLKKSVNDKNAYYKKIIDANYTEAKRNGMNFTPTLYFNGYMYKSNKHPMWILQYIDYMLKNPSLFK